MTPLLLSGPACEPVSLDEAKAWLKIDSAAGDDVLGALITSARVAVEAATRRMLITQTWRILLDAWPRSRVISIPLAPFASLAAINLYDVADAAQPLSASLYTLTALPERAQINLAAILPVPGRIAAGIGIDVVAGYGATPGDVPRPLRQAMLHLVARGHENRGDAQSDIARMPAPAAGLIAPFRRMRLA